MLIKLALRRRQVGGCRPPTGAYAGSDGGPATAVKSRLWPADLLTSHDQTTSKRGTQTPGKRLVSARFERSTISD
jgi:hypothetical protein